jgi:hypothetical protein
MCIRSVKLSVAILESIRCDYALSVIDFGLIQELVKVPKRAVSNFFEDQVDEQELRLIRLLLPPQGNALS